MTSVECFEIEEKRYGCPPDYHGYVVREKLEVKDEWI
jgi:hypothetical protein